MSERRRRRRRKPSFGRFLYNFILTVTVLGSVLAGALLFFLPWYNSDSTMPQDGQFLIQEQPNGNLLLSWPRAKGAHKYMLEILIPAATAEEEPRSVYRTIIDGNACTIPVPGDPDQQRLIRVSSLVEYSTPLKEEYRLGEEPLELLTDFRAPRIRELTWKPDADTKTVSITYVLDNADTARLYRDENGVLVPIVNCRENQLQLRFAEDGDLPMIPFGGESRIILDATRENDNLRFIGYYSDEFTVVRDHLLGRNLNLQMEDMGHNVLRLTWDETKGDHYLVQKCAMGSTDWETVEVIPGDGVRSYKSPHLPPFHAYSYRVVAAGGETLPHRDLAAVSRTMDFETKESAVYATIWPTKDLDAYTDPQKTMIGGHVVTGQAYCVLEEVEGMFAVRVDNDILYIDSNYCLINLPEYMGHLCAYQISNSDSSIFLMHEFNIDNLSGKVINGYSDIKLSDGTYVVPLLYPTAQRLLQAAHAARDQGYRLKIYDAFRPNVATTSMYYHASQILDKNLPKRPYTNVTIDSLDLPLEDIHENDHTNLLYRDVMLGDYTLNYYVANGRSNHNYGIALDLTLETLDTGREIKMQTSMHDLSHYSALSNNNSSAWVLQKIMTGAGFTTLTSEWWHFNDLTSKNTFSSVVVTYGLSVEGWVADDYGWRYRNAKGEYLTDVTYEIDGVSYTFRSDGYLLE